MFQFDSIIWKFWDSWTPSLSFTSIISKLIKKDSQENKKKRVYNNTLLNYHEKIESQLNILRLEYEVYIQYRVKSIWSFISRVCDVFLYLMIISETCKKNDI